ASLKPGMWYRPLPPIMPISACCNCAPDGGWFSSLERQGGRGCGKEPLPPQPPQRLKPPLICDGCGAAKAAPFQSKTKVDYTRWGSWLCGRGLVLRFFLRPEIRFYIFCGLVVEAFADQNLIASDFNYDHSFLAEPGVAAAQGSPGICGGRIFFYFAIRPQALVLLIARG